eukprot:15265055-Alexandrium_andersonii.AAC.1
MQTNPECRGLTQLMPATEPNARRLGASPCLRVSLLTNTKYILRAIGFTKAITLLTPRGDRAADQPRGLRKQGLPPPGPRRGEG